MQMYFEDLIFILASQNPHVVHHIRLLSPACFRWFLQESRSRHLLAHLLLCSHHHMGWLNILSKHLKETVKGGNQQAHTIPLFYAGKPCHKHQYIHKL